MRIARVGTVLCWVLGGVCAIATTALLLCLMSVAIGREAWIDSLFPPLVVVAPVALVGMMLAPTLAGFLLMTASRRLTPRQRRGCGLAIAAPLLQAMLLWFLTPTRAAPTPPDSVSRERMMAAAHALRKSVRSVNWSHPDFERRAPLVGSDREHLEDAMASYDGLAQSEGTPEARYWLALCEAVSGQRRSALLHLGWEQNFGYYRSRFPVGTRFNAADSLPGRATELRRRLLDAMVRDTPPRQLHSQLYSSNDAGRNVEDALIVARAFAARKQWRPAAWILKLATDRTEWMWRHQPQGEDIVGIFEFLAHCYDEWAQAEPARARMLHELAAKSLRRAAPVAPERARELHARAGEEFLQGGSPLRALFQLRRAKNLDSKKPLPARFQQSFAQAQAAVEKLVGAGLVEKRMQDLNTISALQEQLTGYGEGFFDEGPGSMTRQIKQIIDRFGNVDDSLIEDAAFFFARRFQQQPGFNGSTTRRMTIVRKRNGSRVFATAYSPEISRVRRSPQEVLAVYRKYLARFPEADQSAEAAVEMIRIETPGSGDLGRRLSALAAAVHRYPDHPGTAVLLRDVWTTVRSLVGQTGRTQIEVPGADAEFREAVKVLAQVCRAHLLIDDTRRWREAAAELTAVNLSIPNALLRNLLAVAMMEQPDLAPGGAPGRAGVLYFANNDYPRAAKQFARALEQREVYSHQELARLGLALCKPRRDDLPEALSALATRDAVEIASNSQTGLLSADKSERAKFVAAAFATQLSEAALQPTAQWVTAGFQRELQEAQVLRMQRAREFRGLAHAIEEVILRYPDHRDAALLFARLCSVERRAIPNEGFRVQGSEFGRDEGMLERCARGTAQWLLRAARRVRFDGALAFDGDAFAARRAPTWFRLRRVAHRALNRFAWNARMRWQFEAPPSSETARFDLADWHFRDEYGSAVSLDRSVKFEPEETLTLPAVRQAADRCSSDSRCFSEHADGKVIAGPMMEEVVRRYPHSKLKRRALLTALTSRQAALESLNEESPSDRARARELFDRARAGFLMLRDEFPRTRELIEAASTWHGIREMRVASPTLFGLDKP